MFLGESISGRSSTYFIRTLEAGGNDFAYDVHKILCLLNDMVHFDKCGRLSHGGLFDRKLKSLHQRRNFIHMFWKLLFRLSRRNLKIILYLIL